jgi:glycosyltransferase involved in cell wall biosynthesis
VLEINGDHINEMSQLAVAQQGYQRKISMFVMKNNVLGATAFVATGEGWRRRFAEQWGVNENRITVIENGSEVIDLLYRKQTRSFQTETSYSDRTHIVFIGSFDPWQGIDIMLEAFAQAVQQESNIHLSIIGSGIDLSEKIQWVKKHHLENCVSFLGWLPMGEVASYLRCADIGVSPYCGRVEFSGLKLLDYKAAGLAIIASGQDGEPRILKHGKTGWIVPPCDVSALKNAIIQLSHDKLLRNQLGQAARIEAEQYHSWRVTAQNLEQVFLSVI